MKTVHLLDTGNQRCYVYTTEESRLEVLGGIRIDTIKYIMKIVCANENYAKFGVTGNCLPFRPIKLVLCPRSNNEKVWA